MNSREFTDEINKVIAQGLKAVEKKEMDPSQLVGCMLLQLTQVQISLFAIVQAQLAQRMANQIVTPDGQKAQTATGTILQFPK